jgi:hypothetical protein
MVLAFLHDGGEGRAERHRDSGEEGGGANDTLGFTHTGCSCASSDRCSLVVQRPCRALLASSMRVPGAVAVECANGAAVCKQFIENMPPSKRHPKQLESESSMQTSFRALQLVPPLHGWSCARWRWKAHAPSLVEE